MPLIAKATIEGSIAPVFTLLDATGKKRSLKEFKGLFTVIFFYPKDNTPGCTIEAMQFSKYSEKIKSLGGIIIGISGGDEKSKAKFCEKHNLTTLLLADPDFAVAKTYDAYGEKKFMGKVFKGVYRKTFILDKSHKIIKIYDKVKPLSHAKEVLEFLENLSK